MKWTIFIFKIISTEFGIVACNIIELNSAKISAFLFKLRKLMGNCISRRRRATQTRNPTEGMSSKLNLFSMTHEIFDHFAKPSIWNALGLPVGKTRPLAPDPPLWRTDVRITRDQLLRKRDEFWDTAPVYEGRAEIWQALRAAAQAHEAGDVQLAQALITGANIFIPRGILFVH